MGQVVKHLGNCLAVCRPGSESLLSDAAVVGAMDLLRNGKKLSVPIKRGDTTLLIRRRKRNNFAFLEEVTSKRLPFETPLFDVYDPIMNRHFICTEIPAVTSLPEFLASATASSKEKFDVLKKLFAALKKLEATGLRHGDVHAGNLFVTEKGDVLFANPEIDDELTSHLDADSAQLKNSLRTLERELNFEPADVWEKAKNTLYK